MIETVIRECGFRYGSTHADGAAKLDVGKYKAVRALTATPPARLCKASNFGLAQK
jgi:hypothetical protein